MRIVRRNVLTNEEVFTMEVSDEAFATMMCRLLNITAKLNESEFYYKIIDWRK